MLKPCPCGAIPSKLDIYAGPCCKYAFVTGDCCNEWHIEFRIDCLALDLPKVIALAEAAWNGAPRIEDRRYKGVNDE